MKFESDPNLVLGIILLVAGCARGPAVAAPTPTDAPRFAAGDSVSIDTVAPRVVHYHVRRPTGPFSIHVVTVPAALYEITAARALDSLHGRERVTDMVRRERERGARIPIALNADFFDLRTGANENNQVINGEVWKSVPVTDSPHDTFRNAHTQFAIGADGRPYLDRFTYAGSLTGTCGRFVVDGINGMPRVADALVIFTGAYGNAPMADSARAPAQLVAMGPAARPGHGIEDVDLTIVAALGAGASGILPDRYILAAYGSARARLDSITHCASSPLRLSHAFRPDRGRLTMIVGGWPRVVTDGRNVAASADSVEGTFPRFSAQRHPRSAVGFSRDSSVVYLVAVDGRQQTSAGMTLVELGDFLASIGVF
ncbi:MAG TPA: phosphodiester glycosidase family protein, partial [Gemmatimonadaceae bacterium]|nr:phosphodiester glycosidase family protein [Gemmatimonadaceae bacterium]